MSRKKKTIKKFKALAMRAYPKLKESGICSAHQHGSYKCETCYPDLNGLIRAHMAVFDEFYQGVLDALGIEDPPNGRRGTLDLLKELRARLEQTNAPKEVSSQGIPSEAVTVGSEESKEAEAAASCDRGCCDTVS